VVREQSGGGNSCLRSAGKRIGTTLQQLLIEKVSGRVLYVDMTFGGFLGPLARRHHTIPWEKLAYDMRLRRVRTDITEEQVRAAHPAVLAMERSGWIQQEREGAGLLSRQGL
jgi:hypothetical protein